MKTTRRTFLQTSALMSMAAAQGLRAASAETGRPVLTPRNQKLDGYSLAASHALRWDVPGPSFFEGMLLGNGDVGVCVEVRPDALGLHIAKNDCWDIRVTENPPNAVLPFDELRQLWKLASEEAIRMGKPDMVHLESNIDVFRQYTDRADTSYSQKWPRPWPCGTIWMNWDPRWVQVKDYSLNPANGLFEVNINVATMDAPARPVKIRGFVDWTTGLISVSTDNALPLEAIAYIPAVDSDQAKDHAVLPPPRTSTAVNANETVFTCHQHFPAIGPTESHPFPSRSDKDRNFSLKGQITGNWSLDKDYSGTNAVFQPRSTQSFQLNVFIATPRDLLLRKKEEAAVKSSTVEDAISIPQDLAYSAEELDTATYVEHRLTQLATHSFEEMQKESEGQWRNYWSRSAIELEDKDLENIWYLNQYFLACCLKKNKTAPGLFANWHTGDIGSAWHNDYHLDYNCQQVYWGVFSSNHVDMNSPYVELCENLMPIAEKFAKDNYKLPGAFFPLSSYPVPNQSVAYPVPPWGYQVSMTPWAVQSLWWQYLYTQDEEFLRRAYPTMRAAVRFLAAFVTKESDGYYHITPTVSSENWGFTVNDRLNKDCILDLALTKFLLRAMVTASEVLGVDKGEAVHWRDIYENLAPYPKADGPHGEVWLDVANAPLEHIYNIPITLAPVFPGEDLGVEATTSARAIAVRTAKTIRLEGGNDLVFQPLIRARLRMLDFEWFKGQVKYCSLPDGIANDRVRQAGGRYSESMNFDFMMHMGVWCENFALPAVLNECLMQSYSGTIHLFPNVQGLGPARFQSLRAAGAFLVNAIYDGRKATNVTLYSEKGKRANIAQSQYASSARVTRVRDGQSISIQHNGTVFSFDTDPGESYRIELE